MTQTCSSASISWWTAGRVTSPKESVARAKSSKAASPGASQLEQDTLSHWGREIRLIPRPMGRSQKVLTHNGEGSAL